MTVKKLKKNIIIFLLLLVIFGGFFAVAQTVNAQADTLGITEVEENIALGSQDIRITIAKIIRAILTFLGIIAVLIVLYGGFVFMTSGGNEEKISTAKKILINGAIGLAIILSSFAITQFVLNRLSDATGFTTTPGGETVDPRCSDPNFYNLHPDICGGGDFPNCEDRHFVVKSITPNTASLEMNNIAVRVIFSRELDGTVAASDVFEVLKDGTDVQAIDAVYVDGNRSIVEATYDTDELCSAERQETCFSSGAYRVEVNQDVIDESGNPLEIDTSCGTYPRTAIFGVDTDNNIDIDNPVMGEISINNDINDGVVLRRGRSYPIEVEMNDNFGNSFIRVQIYKEDSTPDNGLTLYDGPRLSDDSSDSYSFEYSYTIPTTTEARQRFIVEAVGYDIDHNFSVDTSSFVIVGEHCDASGRPISPEYEDECLGQGGDDCIDDSDCASGFCDPETNQCVDLPVILDVDPWEGASNNFVTVLGRNFGSVIGTVEFSVGDDWVEANLADCGDTQVWTNDWIVVAVPDDNRLPLGSESAIRVSAPMNGDLLIDTTINNNGPINGPRNGLFLKNDISRPGLCSVKTKVQSPEVPVDFALPGTEILALGSAFGGDQGNNFIQFGNFRSQVSAWSDNSIDSSVPESLNPGEVAVKVSVNDVLSNGIPFTVLGDGDTDTEPVVESISPTVITPGSYLTIYGRNLGQNPGTVHLADTAGIACNDENCIPTETILPAVCGDTWSDEQIVVKIGEETAVGTYYLSVNVDGVLAQTDGVEALTVEDGAALPSICRLSPNTGPAPLPVGSEGLDITGINFGTSPVVYFWWKDANVQEVSNTWLSTLTPGDWLISASNNQIITLIPETNDNYSMETGPIRVGIEVDGQTILSNGVQYTVEDCRENPDSPISETHKCCTVGEDAGIWRPVGTACKGEVRSAGYTWRFTTGYMPQVPQVVEACEEDDWFDTDLQLEFPSPTPWERWRKGRQACLNSEIAVRFTLPMDQNSFTDNVLLYSCGNGEEIDCEENSVAIEDINLNYEEEVIRLSTTENLEPNTWYHVELLEGIRSLPQQSVLGVAEVPSQPLQITRPCGDGTAYCFDFKTGGELCTLTAAGMNPPEYITEILGELPFYYYLWGRGNQECSVLPVDGLGWDWTTDNNSAATIQVESDEYHTDTKAKGDAKAHTAPDSVQIIAQTDISTTTGGVLVENQIIASSTLIIDLQEPEVVDFWPDCAEACINTGFGVRFSRHMNPETYQNNIYLQKCSDELCNEVDETEIALDVPADNQNYFELHSYLLPLQVLEKDSWYKVTVRGGQTGIVSIGQFEPEQRDGKALPDDFSWKFRTKSDNVYCQINDIRLQPNPHVSNVIGEKTRYSAFSYGSPDTCNPYGQELNPWNYGWDWRSLDESVVDLSDFTLQGNPNSFCNLGCVPSGSDIQRDSYTRDPFLCGNGVLDPGEDCDIAKIGEEVGKSCTLNCLRPGSTGENCGNAEIETALGEECDPALNEFCNNNCTWSGSSTAEPQGNLDLPWCGSRDVTVGEDCDIGISLDDASFAGDLSLTGEYGCSNSCLHTGTPLSQAWCSNSAFSGSVECLNAVSVCGNGVLEDGEQCEIGINGITDNNCNDRCLFINVCDTPFSQCDSGVEGCTEECTLAGSSVSYSESSLCGDAVVGIGESSDCELEVLDANLQAGLNPIQVATAIGEGVVDEETLRQFAKIEAEAVMQRTSTTPINLPAGTVVGDADYYLQCGYTEYDSPRDGLYNDCADNSDNIYGVAENSCCFERLSRIDEYPESGSNSICRNSLISVTFDGEIDDDTLSGNLIIASGSDDQDFDCTEQGQQNVTGVVNGALAYNQSDSFFARLWHRVKNFFLEFFGDESYAAIETWCSGAISTRPEVSYSYLPDGTVGSSTVSIYLEDLLDPETTYAVLLTGGGDGIRDTRGVGIKNPENSNISDAWQFRTGSDICKLKAVEAVPDSHLFYAPQQEYNFIAMAISETPTGIEQEIVRIPGVYYWEWAWGPNDSRVFSIPVEGDNSNAETVNIASREVEGYETGVLSAKITVDIDSQNNQTGLIFTDLFDLTAMFCEKPWPERMGDLWRPYDVFEREGYYFTMSYCLDAGVSGVTFDDLPFIRPVDIDQEIELAEDTQKQVLFFNDKNDDVIGVQIFSNPDFLNINEWYSSKGFENVDNMRRVEVDGYQGLADDNNFYINAYNLTGEEATGDSTIYRNVYLFSININASQETRQVFEQLINSLKFNTNMSDLRYCTPVDGGDPAGFCLNDFDCPSMEVEQTIECPPEFTCGDQLDYQGQSYGTLQIGSQCWMAENINIGTMINSSQAQTDNNIIEKYCLENNETNCNNFGGLYRWDESMNYSNISGSRGICPVGWHIPTDEEWKILEEQEGMCEGLGPGPEGELCSDDVGFRGTNQGELLKVGGASNFNAVANGFTDLSGLFGNPAISFYWSSRSSLVGNWVRKFVSNIPTIHRLSLEGDYGSYIRCIKDNSVPPQCEDQDAGLIDMECNADRTEFLRDLDRLEDISGAQRNLDIYRSQNGTYPFLSSGTFIPGYTVSKWPSWGNRLGSDIQGVAVDPVNQWTGCEAVDPNVEVNTCWNAEQSKYICPQEMSVYEYEYESNENYIFHAPLEFLSLNNSIIDRYGINRGRFDTEPYCVPNQTHTPEGGVCGDSVVNAGESCDPPGRVDAANCRICTDQCTWQPTECPGVGICGNGVVDQGELCDDGELNGSYGHCGEDCNALSGLGYCGDTVFQEEYEFCDWSMRPLWGQYAFEMEKSCSIDCQGYGGYCGDNLVQPDYETCDDGNLDNFDGCSEQCERENNSCYNAGPYLTTSTADNSTDIYISRGNYDVFDSSSGDYEGQAIPECTSNITGNQICHSYGLSCDQVLERYGKLDEFNILVYYTRCYGSGYDCNNSCSVELNITNSNGYRVECEGVYEGPVQQGVEAENIGACGDNVVQAPNNEGVMEACDLGSQNGIPCQPEYGQNCTYCSADCRNVLFREPTAYCGDGIVQAENGEKCETVGENIIVSDEVCSQTVAPSFVRRLNDGKVRVQYYPEMLENSEDNMNAICSWLDEDLDDPKVIACKLLVLSLVHLSSEADLEDMLGYHCSEDPSIICDPNDQTTCLAPDDGLILDLKEEDYSNNISNYITNDVQFYGECLPNYTLCNENNVLTCTDLGSVSCSESCQKLDNNCVECTASLDQNINTIANMAFLNPITGGGVPQSTLGEGTNWWAFPERNFDGLQHVLMYRWYDPDRDGIEDGYTFGWRRLGSTGNGSTPIYFDYTIQEALRNSGSSENLSGEKVRLESDALCVDEYKLYFSPLEIKKSPAVNLNIYNRDQLLNYGDLFSYPVSGQTGPIEHEYIVSPAVPDNVFRVVVRWTDKEDDRNVIFNGVLYSQIFDKNAEDLEERKALIKNLSEAISDTTNPADPWYCDQMEQTTYKEEAEYNSTEFNHGRYFWPTACNPYTVIRPSDDFTRDQSRLLFVHPVQSLDKTFIQAMTIDTNGWYYLNRTFEVRPPIAFFVEAIGSLGEVPISNFTNSNLTVDIYTFHEGQVPAHSVYKPITSFSIKSAQSSSNPTARYWHVFNLEWKSENLEFDWRISPVQQIQTGFCDVLNDTPNTICTP
ncbi:MAG: hypothetical protein GF349_00060 [Candidatus Magasanikbacteria bacterium]|nr:hypothetical protein [Candidatus Magasanikbacteria bacterium]